MACMNLNSCTISLQQALMVTVTAGEPEPSSEWMAELELRLAGHLLDCILCSWLCTGPCC